MSKPFATAIVADVFSAYGPTEHPVQVSRSKAQAVSRGESPSQFYAPGWRPMVFRTVEAAKAKMERHPGFVRWVS